MNDILTIQAGMNALIAIVALLLLTAVYGSNDDEGGQE